MLTFGANPPPSGGGFLYYLNGYDNFIACTIQAKAHTKTPRQNAMVLFTRVSPSRVTLIRPVGQ